MFDNSSFGFFLGMIFVSLPLINQLIRRKKREDQLLLQLEERKEEKEKESEKEKKNSSSLSKQTKNSSSSLLSSSSQSYPPPPPPPSFSPFSSSSSDQIEILLHNVSHTDMVMSIKNNNDNKNNKNSNDNNDEESDESIIARPKFSCFREISSKIESSIREVKLEDLSTIRHPVYSRETNARHPIIRSSINSQYLDVGFNLLDHSVVIENIEQLRFRQKDREKISKQNNLSTIDLSAVYFPLLSMLIPKWLNEVDTRGKSESRKIVFLVSGQGTPRDESARIQDNSTEITAIIMEMFLKKVYPTLEVIQVPSPTINLFRYADNIIFVKRILKPKLDAIRNELAAIIGAKWLENLHLTMSFADGSSARTSAINAAIRSYR